MEDDTCAEDHDREPDFSEGRFGGCPHCGRNDGFLNVGSDHHFVCDVHRVRWWAATGLFSCWMDDTPDIIAANKATYDSYTKVEPIYPAEDPWVVQEDAFVGNSACWTEDWSGLEEDRRVALDEPVGDLPEPVALHEDERILSKVGAMTKPTFAPLRKGNAQTSVDGDAAGTASHRSATIAALTTIEIRLAGAEVRIPVDTDGVLLTRLLRAVWASAA